jgi:hypothetical protein
LAGEGVVDGGHINYSVGYFVWGGGS